MKLQDFDFRAYDNHNKKYIDNIPYSIKKYQNENEVFLPFSTDLREYGFNEIFKNEIQIPSDRVEVELWTGFYDKNGKKIYENDILKNEVFDEYYLVSWNETSKMLRVYTYDTNAQGKLYKKENAVDISFFKTIPSNKYMEVIGNIHENPELLEY
ncbi:hypothetical protein KJQ78_08390 [Campylobacter lari]|uniref:YopX family protein n=1 Tax=Campylobacter lari TaxID=201 RepID=UPI00128191CF|nr:YopX family protein [Campylobacter lari]MBT0825268.1 hypothetical protein [Campylobacter lari]